MTEIFEDRISNFKNQEIRAKLISDRWSAARALLFLSVFLLPYWAYKSQGTSWAFCFFVVFFSLFLIAIKKHLLVERIYKKIGFLVAINTDELARLNRVFVREETGLEYLDVNHFYASDLDLFGKKSLFKLLNRTRTSDGSALLANWMLVPASKLDVIDRQLKIAELSEKINFRQEFESTSMLYEKQDFSTQKLFHWLSENTNSKSNNAYQKAFYLLPFLFVLVVLAWFFEMVPASTILVSFAVNAYFLKKISPQIKQETDQINSFSGALEAYIEMIRIFENENWNNQGLVKLQDKVSKTETILKELNHIFKNLSNRSNPFFLVTISIPLFWDYWYYIKLNKWKSAHSILLKNCIATVSELEALNSLAGFKYAHPAYQTPHISDEIFLIKTTSMGHPNIHPQKRKNNDLEINGLGSVIILTGSNMSGKSTFQRTIGVNVVLAQMGAVVCAEAFVCSNMQLFTSMRSNDSLEEDTSSFYAELKRLGLLLKTLDKSNNAVPILYFLDEILKGTNSKDRHTGGKALIEQLHKLRASGLISTHDVELGNEYEGKSFIANYSFSSTTSQGKLLFDYQLRKGVCQSFNATELMKQIGIAVDVL